MPAQGKTCGSDDVRVDSIFALAAFLFGQPSLYRGGFLFPDSEYIVE